MGRTSKHHFLPQCYLRGFAGVRKPNHVCQIEKRRSPIHCWSAIGDAAVQRDFHTVDRSDGARDDQSIETDLSKIEGLHCALVTRLARGECISAADQTMLVEHVSLMRMRVPAVKEHLERQQSESWDAYLQMLARGGRLETVLKKRPSPAVAKYPPQVRKAIAERAARMIGAGRLKVVIGNGRLLSAMYGAASNPNVLEILLAMSMTIIDAPAGAAFITSDQPVALFLPQEAGQVDAVGLVSPGVELTLPLSSSTLVLMDRAGDGFTRRVANPQQVAEYNRRTVTMARRFIFTSEPSAENLALVGRNAGAFAGFEIRSSGFGSDRVVFNSRTVPVRPESPSI